MAQFSMKITRQPGSLLGGNQHETFSEKSAAEKAAKRVKDVKAIAEEIEVRLPFTVTHGDEEIAAAAIGRLNWDSSVPADSVQAKVEKGWITLTGDVDWHFQKEAAADDIRGLWGVKGVSNQINIKPRPDTGAILDKILTALDRSWFDPATINVSADGGKVKLTGKVNTWYERDEAGYAAWAAPGTTAVVNDIFVN